MNLVLSACKTPWSIYAEALIKHVCLDQISVVFLKQIPIFSLADILSSLKPYSYVQASQHI